MATLHRTIQTTRRTKADQHNRENRLNSKIESAVQGRMEKVLRRAYDMTRIRSLPVPHGRIGIDCHVIALNRIAGKRGLRLPDIEHYLDGLSMQPQSRAVLASNIKRLVRQQLGVSYELDLATKTVVDQLFRRYRAKRKPRRRKFVPPASDIARLIARSGDRVSLFVEFLYLSASRTSELCKVELACIRDDGDLSEVRVIEKGGDEVVKLLPRKLIDTCRYVFRGRRYLFETKTKKPYTRLAVLNMVRAASESVLGYRIVPRDLRHAFCTHMYQDRPGLLRALLEQTGHNSADVFISTYNHQRLALGDLPDLRKKTG